MNLDPFVSVSTDEKTKTILAQKDTGSPFQRSISQVKRFITEDVTSNKYMEALHLALQQFITPPFSVNMTEVIDASDPRADSS